MNRWFSNLGEKAPRLKRYLATLRRHGDVRVRAESVACTSQGVLQLPSFARRAAHAEVRSH